MTPPEPKWWGPADEEILRGELAKLAALPRRASLADLHAQPTPGAQPTTYRTSWFRRFWVRHPIAARVLILIPLMVIGAFLGMAIRDANAHDREPYRIPDSGYPTTYGPSGPNGGPQ